MKNKKVSMSKCWHQERQRSKKNSERRSKSTLVSSISLASLAYSTAFSFSSYSSSELY
jgi:hypothetical protein